MAYNPHMRKNIAILFSTRIVRLFCYGFLSVVLALYLAEVGLNPGQIGLLFTLTLLGDAAISLFLSTRADRFGRKRTLIVGALLMAAAGMAFLLTNNFILLAVAAIIGVLSPSGNEIGPFLPVEQAGLSQIVADEKRTGVFAWYNLAGSFATALGALTAGWLVQLLRRMELPALEAYRTVLAVYAVGGFVLAVLFLFLGKETEAPTAKNAGVKRILGLHKSKAVVLKLSSLFALDAFAGGFIVQSMFALWFQTKFGLEPGLLGSIFFGANIMAGISALLAARVAKRFGLINTMVFTHIPSNILLILVPLMPSLPLAIVVLLLRFSISQMDVPTRQSYTMAVVDPDERSAASGVTGIARSLGASISPSLAGIFLGIPGLLSLPFFLCGGLKIAYDLALYRSFKTMKPPEELKP
jgi:MFS family permease